ncbi:hypothetical protein LINPERPRIM_LOCUS37645 [Linum perenne]
MVDSHLKILNTLSTMTSWKLRKHTLTQEIMGYANTQHRI